MAQEAMDFEYVLMEVGENGKYQKLLIVFFLLPLATLFPLFSMNILFMLSVPDHWCSVAEVVHSNLTMEQQRQLISAPSDSNCRMYDINYTDYLSSRIYTVPNATTTRPCSSGWEYDKTYYESTAATQGLHSMPSILCRKQQGLISEVHLELIAPPSGGGRWEKIRFPGYVAVGSVDTRFVSNNCIASPTYVTSDNRGLIPKWNMICEDSHYPSLVLTLYYVGSIIGTPVYGALSDRIGRKITFYICLTVTAVSAIASVLMTDFTAFVVIKTIHGALWPSVFQIPYIIVLELVAPEMRAHINGMINLSWSFGMAILPLVAYLSRSWVTLGHVTSSLTVICFIYWRYLPESPRWLLSQERYDEALTIMKKIGDVNGKSPDPDQLLAKLKTLGDKIRKERTVDNVKNSSSDLVKYPQLRKIFIIVSACWTAFFLSYYGLLINLPNLAGNEFLNFFLTAIVEIPGYITCWLLMNKLGRRWMTVMWFLMTGLICIAQAVVSGLPYADITCSMLGKYCASAVYIAIYQQSAELYPTVVRSLGMGLSSTFSMAAVIIAPYLIYLAVYGKAIPFVAIGSSCIMAGIAASFLPETLNESLPQTICDAEEFGKDQKYFSWNRRKC